MVDNGLPGVPIESVVLVGTFPPTECGIATYTANLRSGLEASGLEAKVLRVLDAVEDTADPDQVVGRWLRGDPIGAESAARVASTFDSVLVQHEFGIYPGVDGGDVIRFVESCHSPVFTVFHTVLEAPTVSQRRIVDSLVSASELVFVHTGVALARLLSVHDMPSSKVAIVPHGATPNLCGPPMLESAESIMLTWGLLGPGKGIERGIEAVAQMRAAGLDVRYVVAGETHPNVRRRDGDRYRDSLRVLARERGVADLVEFHPGYQDWESVRAMVQSAAVVLLPYDSRDQVTSGVLVEALAAGKPVVATAFPHAVELSRTGAVVVVDHVSPDGIASAAMTILRDSSLRARMETAARAESSQYAWPVVGKGFHRLINSALHDASLRPYLAG